jgi:3-phosphoshikimate 1-carboxyvinyltransferase
MQSVTLNKARSLRGELLLPPDKSISHRAIMFASIAKGKSKVGNFLRAEDPLSTLNAFRMLGIEIHEEQGTVVINGKGLQGLREPFDVIDCGNSGTTARLISGILAGSPFFSTLTGDDSLRQRPMRRVIGPLQAMGARVSGRSGDAYLPIAIKGGNLKAMNYEMPVASAQVKSCLILAGLYADGVTSVTEPYKSRDHTEKMLSSMGASIESGGPGMPITIKGGTELGPLDITVPADFSSAAFFLAAALLVPDSELVIKSVGVNDTRSGLIDIIRKMGGPVELLNRREISGEPVADLYCKYTRPLAAVRITKENIPSLVDEFPILCVLATQAEGITEIRGAEELRVKESDRISTMASELRKLGAEAEEYPDGIAIKGGAALKGCRVNSHGDHRIAMSMAVAALVAEGTTVIDNASCADISFPSFFEQLKKLLL